MLRYHDRVVPLQVLLYRVDQAGRVGVCGNGVCEVGELVAVSEDGTVSAGCVQDCRLPVLACPLDAEGTSCAGAPPLLASTFAFYLPICIISREPCENLNDTCCTEV